MHANMHPCNTNVLFPAPAVNVSPGFILNRVERVAT